MLEHSPLVWAEISVTDMNRAVEFYQTHFDLTFKHEMMVPSRDGSTVYLHLSLTLNDKVNEIKAAGVEILLPPMPLKMANVATLLFL